jgi:hypothetical protein
MTYTTVFDATHQGYTTWNVPAYGLAFIAVGALLAFRPALTERILPGGLKGRARRIFGFCFFGFAILWTLGAFMGTFSQYLKVADAVHSGKYAVVQGPVTSFVPMPYGGHAEESFCVQKKCFSYSDYVVTTGFNNTASHGGPIHEGLQVRITYIDNIILRLETSQ